MRDKLVTRTPTRISLAGGGTDLEAYYAQHGGMVVSAAINLYTYVTIAASERQTLEVTCEQPPALAREIGGAHSCPGLALPHAALEYFGIRSGLRVHVASQVPPGTGLGSSSSMAVGLAKGLSAVLGREVDAREAAEMACELEIERMGMPIGRQDQYAAAFGGLNSISFTSSGVLVEPLSLPSETTDGLLERLLLFYTGSSRMSSTILRQQRDRTAGEHRQTLDALHAIKAMAREARDILERGDLDQLGELLHASWLQKKSLGKQISSPFIDEVYDVTRQHGALGGKITGAGGGGFLLLYVRKPDQPAVTCALKAHGLRRVRFGIDGKGAQVIHNSLATVGGRLPGWEDADVPIPISAGSAGSAGRAAARRRRVSAAVRARRAVEA